MDPLIRTLLREGESGMEEREREAASAALRATCHPVALRALLVMLATQGWLGEPLQRDPGTTLCGVRRVENLLDQLFRDMTLGFQDKRRVMLDGLADNDARIRSMSANYLQFYADPDVIAALATALRDRDALVRERAAEALGLARDPAAVAPLVGALEDPDSLVVSRAARALGEIGGPDAIAALVRALRESEDSLVRLFCEQALVAIDPPVLQPLLVALREGNVGYWFRHSAAQVLSRLQLQQDRPLRDELVEALEGLTAGIRVPLLTERFLTRLHEREGSVG
jgi:hypothetical protein